MAHHIYTTAALVVEGTNSGEANKSYLLFTKELGMIRATAQSVRLLKSKLRFSLQDFSYSSVSLVRGKEIWRITSARLIDRLYEETAKKETLFAAAGICFLLKRLMPQEEKHEALLSYLLDAFAYAKGEALPAEMMKSFECVLALTVLHELGYLGYIAELQKFVRAPVRKELLAELMPVRKTAFAEINRSLHETQL